MLVSMVCVCRHVLNRHGLYHVFVCEDSSLLGAFVLSVIVSIDVTRKAIINIIAIVTVISSVDFIVCVADVTEPIMFTKSFLYHLRLLLRLINVLVLGGKGKEEGGEGEEKEGAAEERVST